jgi:hypothetical protein
MVSAINVGESNVQCPPCQCRPIKLGYEVLWVAEDLNAAGTQKILAFPSSALLSTNVPSMSLSNTFFIALSLLDH